MKKNVRHWDPKWPIIILIWTEHQWLMSDFIHKKYEKFKISIFMRLLRIVNVLKKYYFHFRKFI